MKKTDKKLNSFRNARNSHVNENAEDYLEIVNDLTPKVWLEKKL